MLVTTPESLYILLTSQSGRRMLRTVKTVIVDEIHALARDKRGSHLALSLERLEALAGPFQRIGLSATQKPLSEVAGFWSVSAGSANWSTSAIDGKWTWRSRCRLRRWRRSVRTSNGAKSTSGFAELIARPPHDA